MGQPLKGAEAASEVGVSDFGDSVTGVGVPNVLLATARDLERGDVLGARYQIEAVIGTGGSGRVLRAFDRESRTPVALKILRAEFAADPVWAERFSRELRIGRSITHANVCRVYDIGDADGHKFLSMELASGGSIRADVPKVGATRMTPTRKLRSWSERTADAQAVVDGIAALHSAGIVHRDIKPENILRMEDGRLVVTDFGLATDPGANGGNTVMVGTPSYMAPEVVMGDPATVRSDVWGLGIVLHEILFGCRPQWKALGRGHRRFVLPDEVITAAQRAAAELCGRCADDAAELRPASATAVKDELERALRGKRVMSRVRRRQVTWAAIAVASFAALGLIRDRWTSRAEASSSQAANPLAERVLEPTGTPDDWSKDSTKLASFAGRLHCYSQIDGGRRVRVIWGAPRRAEDIDVKTGARTSSDLRPETYRDGCPASSPDGRSLLFERASDRGNHVYLSRFSDGREAVEIVRGSQPEWLPNGREFVFGFDAKNAGLFSLPTGEMMLVPPDSQNPARQILELAVDVDGAHLGVFYRERLQNLLVVYDLPSFAVVRRVVAPPSILMLRFASPGQLIFSANRSAGDGLISMDIGSGLARNVAFSANHEIGGTLFASDHTLVANREVREDLWLRDGRHDTRLTSDGVSLSGAMSRDGLLLSQKRLAGGKLAIFLRAPDGREKQVTSGPTDLTPAFFPDGTRWLYADVGKSEIRACEISTGECKAVYSDRLVPGFPSVDPTGSRMAYLTFNDTSRIRVASLESGRLEKDLGPVAGACKPVWVSSDLLWFVQSADGPEMTWVELSTSTGVASGRSEKVRAASKFDCRLPGVVRSLLGGEPSGGDHQVVSVSYETSDLVVNSRAIR